MTPTSGLSKNKLKLPLIISCLSLWLAGCATTSSTVPSHINLTEEDKLQLEQKLPEILNQYDINTAGIGIIKNGELIWTHYHGQQNKEVKANSETMFDVASITKSLVAETTLQLVGDNKISLDEPMHPYWVDPDIIDDPRHKLLTPRMVLTHTTGFLNWRYANEDSKLAFKHDPGEQFGYSGEGFEYLAKFLENKLGKSFPQIVQEQLIDPLKLENTSITVDQNFFAQMAQSKQQDGSAVGPYCRPEGWCPEQGSWSAADALVISVEDYSKFMIHSMDNQSYSNQLAQQRNSMQSTSEEFKAVDCERVGNELCPVEQGYGLGWQVLDYGDYQVVGHGGSDWSETAIAYFYSDSKDGVVVFFNALGQNGVPAMAKVLAAIDPKSPYTDLFKRISERQQSN